MAGHHYYETQAVTKYVDGQARTVNERVRRTRWEPASGRRRDRYDDVLVVASRGLPREIAERLRSFDTSALQPYDPRFLAGWKAEEYGVSLEEGWVRAEIELQRTQRGRCARDVPGDTQRELEVRTHLGERTFKHVLLPLYIATYRYGEKPYRFLVNGQTGEVRGEAPLSPLKIALAVLLVVALFVVFFIFFVATER